MYLFHHLAYLISYEYRLWHLISLLFVSYLLTVQKVPAQENGNQSSFKELDRWYEVFLGGSKVGYSHSTMKLVKGVVKSKSIFVMSVRRAGVVIQIKSMESTVELLSGEIISFSGEMEMAGVPITKNGRVQGNEIVIKEKQFFRENEMRYPLDPEGKMTWGLMKALRENNFKEKGRKFETKVYSADFGMASPTKAKIKTMGETEILLSGQNKKVFKTDISMSTSVGTIKTENWLDSWGFAVKTKMQVGGLPIEIKQSNKIEAKQSPESKEFLLETLISLEKEIPNNAQSVQFKIELTDRKLNKPFYQSELQKVIKLDDKNLIIEIEAEKWGENSARRERKLKVAEEFKTANLMIDSDNPLIRQLAQNAGRGSKNIFELSEKLFFFVQRYLIHKNFKIGFASATETAQKRQGDCTEHAVLLAAMGRSMGIPTRVASGIAYLKNFKGEKNVMGFHMWTEFHLRGKWMRLDSALGKMGTYADRITLSVTSLNQESLTELSFGIAELVGNVKISISKIRINEG
jgi:hypothetical protein